MNKTAVIQQIVECGIVPVIRASSADEALEAIEALKLGGVTTMEVTMTVPGALKIIETIASRYATEVLVGAGTVLDAETARLCISAGAQFIVSPATNLETIALCCRHGICVMPGALTPTEIVAAWQAGADFVKIFPANALGGADYLKSIKAPLPQIELIPTGGVSLKTIADFIHAGAAALGVGANLVDLAAIRSGNKTLLTELARKFIEEVRKARKF